MFQERKKVILVLVMSTTTERPEAVTSGTVKLVGTNADFIFTEVEKLLHDKVCYETVSSKKIPMETGKHRINS